VYDVVIVGAGQVAQGYDNPASSSILTHAHAFTAHGGFRLAGFCDSNLEKARAAAMRWSVPRAVGRVEELAGARPQVVSVCTPVETRAQILADCLNLGPRLVFCEKPLALDSKTAADILHQYAKSETVLAVNYSRRWIDAFRRWKEAISSGGWGRILSVRARYFGGWLHNGSHIVDLLQYFFQPELRKGALLSRQPLAHGDMALTGSALLETESGHFPFSFECLPDSQAAHFELELVFERSVLLSGSRNTAVHERRELHENPIYPGYRYFEVVESTTTDPSEALLGAVANIHGYLTRDEQLLSTGETALETLRLSEEILQLQDIP